MGKMYSADEVMLILVGACNNYCADVSNQEHETAVTSFAKWATAGDESPEWFCERALTYGVEVKKNLNENGSLFQG